MFIYYCHIALPPLDIFQPGKHARSTYLSPMYHYNLAIPWPIRLLKAAESLLPTLHTHIISARKQIFSTTWLSSLPSTGTIIHFLSVRDHVEHGLFLTSRHSLSREAESLIPVQTPASHS